VSVVIESVLPNPVGNDAQFETVTLRNKGAGTVSLVGWALRDRHGGEWILTGSINAGQSRAILPNGAMSLNNAGDEITLLDSGHVSVDAFEYGVSSEGAVIQTGH
jgi:hypothetical protein